MRLPGLTNTVALSLGFGLAAAYVPNAYADAHVGRWAVAWVGVAALLWLCGRAQWSWSGAALLGLAGVSVLWAPEPLNATLGLLQLILLAGAFVVGCAGGAKAVFEGFAWGMVLNAAIAVPEFFGWHPIEHWKGVMPSALFGNKDFLAEAALLAVTPLLYQKRWLMAAAISPALLLPLDRAVIFAAGIVAFIAAARWSKAVAFYAAATALILIAAYSALPGRLGSLNDRAMIWSDSARGLTLFGRGIGQFYNTYPENSQLEPLEVIRPDHAHNDLLELAYELGVPGLALALAFVFGVLIGPFGWEKLAFIELCAIGLFAFPLHNAATAILGLLAAGGVYRAGAVGRDRAVDCAAHAVSGQVVAQARRRHHRRHFGLSARPALPGGPARMGAAQSDWSEDRDQGARSVSRARSLLARCAAHAHDILFAARHEWEGRRGCEAAKPLHAVSAGLKPPATCFGD